MWRTRKNVHLNTFLLSLISDNPPDNLRSISTKKLFVILFGANKDLNWVGQKSTLINIREQPSFYIQIIPLNVI